MFTGIISLMFLLLHPLLKQQFQHNKQGRLVLKKTKHFVWGKRVDINKPKAWSYLILRNRHCSLRVRFVVLIPTYLACTSVNIERKIYFCWNQLPVCCGFISWRKQKLLCIYWLAWKIMYMMSVWGCPVIHGRFFFHIKALIHFLTQLCDLISGYRKPVEWTNETGLEMVSLVCFTFFP